MSSWGVNQSIAWGATSPRPERKNFTGKKRGGKSIFAFCLEKKKGKRPEQRKEKKKRRET